MSSASNGPPILLVHGFASSATADWPAERWANPLSAAGRTALAVPLPGHPGGRAVSSADDATTAALLAWLAGAIRGTGADEVDVVAYSLGARLAWDLAGASPVPVRRLALGGLSPFEPFTAVDVAAARAAVTGGPQPSDPITAMVTTMVGLPGQDPASLLKLVEGLAREPFDPAARPPTARTLFLAGSEDPMSQGIDAVAALVPGARVERVPGDHVGALASEEFRAAVFDFLDVNRQTVLASSTR